MEGVRDSKILLPRSVYVKAVIIDFNSMILFILTKQQLRTLRPWVSILYLKLKHKNNMWDFF